jgi:iron complex outermembrane receptor protein
MIGFHTVRDLIGPLNILTALVFLTLTSVPAHSQTGGTLKGTATLGDSGNPIHNVLVTILELKRTVSTDDNGKYEFQNVPPGKYNVLAHLDRVPDMVQTVGIGAVALASK